MYRRYCKTSGLRHYLCLLAALFTFGSTCVYAAESNKIHIVETKYGDFLGNKTCAPALPRCDATAKCVVEAADSLCKSGGAPEEIQLQVIWDCGELKHAAMAPRGKKLTLTCPYQPGLN